MKERKQDIKGVVHELHGESDDQAGQYFYATSFDPSKELLTGVSLLVQGHLDADVTGTRRPVQKRELIRLRDDKHAQELLCGNPQRKGKRSRV